MLTDDGLAEIREEAKRLRAAIAGLRNVLWVIAVVAAVEMVTLIVTLSGD